MFGQCFTLCGPIAFGGGGGASFSFTIADHPEFLHTLWRLFTELFGPVMVTPHVTLTVPDGLFPTPLPAALPLFAAGLGIVTFLARRKKTKAARPA